MKTGIIVHSQTGNTLQVAEKLAQAIKAEGYEAQVERVTTAETSAETLKNITLTTAPDTAGYDQLLLGAPVQAFALSAAMKTYLSQLPDLKAKRVVCFVTQHFPKAWMGGNRAVKQMCEAVTQKGGRVEASYVINWSSKVRNEQIDNLVTRCAQAIQQSK